MLAGAVGLGVLAACKREASPGTQMRKEQILISHPDGMGVVDAGTGKWLIEPGPAVLPAGRDRLALLRDSQLSIWRLGPRERVSVSKVEGEWKPSAMVGERVALVRRAGAATKIRVTGLDRDFDVPGDIEPEAFSPDGGKLYVLDHLTDSYRVRLLDLETGELNRLNIKDKGLVPELAEEVMRGHWQQAVWDSRTGILFSLYTHGGDHQHTGQLLGVRPNAPDVHAFIHALHLADSWAVCIDLPSPFGDSAAGAHALALGDGRLYAVNAAAGATAEIDRSALKVLSIKGFAPAEGSAFAIGSPFVVAAGERLTDLSSDWRVGGPMSGLAAGPDGLLWTAMGERLVALSRPDRKLVHEIALPGLRSVLMVV